MPSPGPSSNVSCAYVSLCPVCYSWFVRNVRRGADRHRRPDLASQNAIARKKSKTYTEDTLGEVTDVALAHASGRVGAVLALGVGELVHRRVAGVDDGVVRGGVLLRDGDVGDLDALQLVGPLLGRLLGHLQLGGVLGARRAGGGGSGTTGGGGGGGSASLGLTLEEGVGRRVVGLPRGRGGGDEGEGEEEGGEQHGVGVLLRRGNRQKRKREGW